MTDDPSERMCIRQTVHPAHKWMVGHKMLQCPGVTDDPSTNSERQWVCAYPESEPCEPEDWNDERDATTIGCGYYPATPSPVLDLHTRVMEAQADPVLDSERPDTALLREIAEEWVGFPASSAVLAAADWIDAHRCPAPERDDLAGRRAASRPDSIQFRLRQFTPHHPLAPGRKAMMDAADLIDDLDRIASDRRYSDGFVGSSTRRLLASHPGGDQ